MAEEKSRGGYADLGRQDGRKKRKHDITQAAKRARRGRAKCICLQEDVEGAWGLTDGVVPLDPVTFFEQFGWFFLFLHHLRPPTPLPLSRCFFLHRCRCHAEPLMTHRILVFLDTYLVPFRQFGSTVSSLLPRTGTVVFKGERGSMPRRVSVYRFLVYDTAISPSAPDFIEARRA